MPSRSSASTDASRRPARTASYCRGRYWLSSVIGSGRRRRLSSSVVAGALHVRVRPVVADAIAEAVLQVERLAAPVAIVTAPVARIGAHDVEHDFAQAGTAPRPGSSLLDRVERPQRLAQREGRAGPDLEDREVVAHERAAGSPASGSRSNAPRRRTADRGDERAQCARLRRLVVDDLVMIELDARLHDERDHARPGGAEPRARERLAMRRDRRRRGLRCRHRQLVQSSVAPPGVGTSVPIT